MRPVLLRLRARAPEPIAVVAHPRAHRRRSSRARRSPPPPARAAPTPRTTASSPTATAPTSSIDNTPNPEIPIVDLDPVEPPPPGEPSSRPFKYFAIIDDSANAFAAPERARLRDPGSEPAEDPPRPDVEPRTAPTRPSSTSCSPTSATSTSATRTRRRSPKHPATSSGNLVVDRKHATPTKLTFKIVGIAAAPGQFPPQDSRGYLADPPFYLTPAFYRAHARRLHRARRRPRSASSRARRRRSNAPRARRTPRASSPSRTSRRRPRSSKRSFHLQAVALWLAAAALALVGALVVAQLLSRQSSLAAADYPILRGLGMTPRQLWLLGVLRALVLGVAGAVLAIVPAILFSTFTPIGAARRAEPHPGIAVNVTVLVVGIGLTIGIVVVRRALAGVAAARAPARSAGPTRPPVVEGRRAPRACPAPRCR